METAAGVIRAALHVLIDLLLTEEGITGRSYLRCYTAVAPVPLARLVANLEVLVVGEVAETATIAGKLERHFHLLGRQRLALLGFTPTRHRLEYLDHAAPILTEPVRIDDGYAVMPERPGSGLEWNEELIERATGSPAMPPDP